MANKTMGGFYFCFLKAHAVLKIAQYKYNTFWLYSCNHPNVKKLAMK